MIVARNSMWHLCTLEVKLSNNKIAICNSLFSHTDSFSVLLHADLMFLQLFVCRSRVQCNNYDVCIALAALVGLMSATTAMRPGVCSCYRDGMCKQKASEII